MATTTDILETILRVVGGPAYAAQMRAAAAATGGLSAAQQRNLSVGAALSRTIGNLTGSYIGAGLAIGAGTLLLRDSLKAFGDEEKQIFRATVVLRNLGNSYPIEQALAFGRTLEETTSVNAVGVASLIGLEKQFGVTDGQINRTTSTIVDFAKATGTDLPAAGEIFLRAVNGQARGLRALGIQFQDTGNKAHNLAILQAKFDRLFGGAGAAERSTLPGTIDALNVSLDHLLATIGNRISNVLIPALNALNAAARRLNEHPVAASTLGGALGGAGIGAGIGGAVGLLGGPFGVGAGAGIGALLGGGIGLAGGLLGPRPNAANQIGTGKERLATEGTLQQIAKNTAALSPLIQQVIGGPGTVARGAWTFRDQRMAFGI